MRQRLAIGLLVLLIAALPAAGNLHLNEAKRKPPRFIRFRQARQRVELESYLAGIKSAVKGKIVLIGKHALAPINFKPAQLRLNDDEAKAIYAPRPPSTTLGVIHDPCLRQFIDACFGHIVYNSHSIEFNKPLRI